MAELSAKEQLEQMINGTHEDVEYEDAGVDEETENDDEVANEETTESDTVDTEENDDSNDNNEDTDQETDTDDEEETEQGNDDSAEDTSDTEDDGQEENAHNEAEESEDESENAIEEPNYKEFYEKVALAKFTANGKEVEGFKDPDDLVRAQQMLHGYSDKMKVLKEYKPYLKALEERGITSDSEKFNLAMSLLDGDAEALKKVLKEKNINPMELDMEDIQYTPKNVLPSNTQMLIEESYEQAESLGVGDKFSKVISKDWDVPSLQEFVNNGAVRNDLMNHLKDGTYELVQNEINRMEILDSTGSLNGMNSIEKYRAAIGRLQQEAARKAPPVAQPVSTPTVDKVEASRKAAEAAEFKRKAAEREQKVAEERNKAASVSKKRVASKPKPAPKLEELKGDEFRNAFRDMLMS